MSINQSKEFFINMKDVPRYDPNKHFYEQTKEVYDFYEQEEKKIKEGLTIDGVFIHPWLYFHSNFFKTPIPDERGNDQIINPPMRDNEWFFAENYHRADVENRGLFIFGSRRFAKSSMISSLLQWKAITSPNSKCTVSGGSSEDLEMLSLLLKTSFTHIDPAFRMTTNANDWNKAVELGLKTKAGEFLTYSNILIRNLQKGQSKESEKTAGATPSAFVLDEAGKFECAAPYEAALPSFEFPGGWRCVPILTGCLTAGNKVWNGKGDLVNIEDLDKEDGIVGYTSTETIKEKINWFKPPAKKECVKIYTKSGNTIECSTDHPILCKRPTNCGQSNYTKVLKAGDLQPGNHMMMIDTVGLHGTINQPHARLFGLMVGDGNFNKSSHSLAVNEIEIEDYITKRYTTKINKNKVTITNPTGCKQFGISGIMDLTREEGLWGTSKETKRFPKNIGKYNKESLCEFIAGYFDADGSVKVSKNSVRICLTSKYFHLLENMKFYLTKLGIHSNIGKEFRKGGFKSGTIYRLYISTYLDVKRFHENITLLVKEKQNRVEEVFNINPVRFYNSGVKKFKFYYDINSKKGWYLEGKKLSNLRPVTISKVEFIGEKEVYNLNTSITNSYIANGIVTFNTGGNEELSQDAMRMLTNPTAFKLLTMDWDTLENKIEDKNLITWTRKTFGIFVPGQMSYKTGIIKDKNNLSEYMGVDNDFLREIKILTTNWKTSLEVIDKDREDKKDDKVALNKETMYYPKDPDDCFLSRVTNPFPAKVAMKHKQRLLDQGRTGKRVEIYKKEDGCIGYTFSNKEPADYPHPGGAYDAPFLIFEEPPQEIPEYGTYVSGFDGYKQNIAQTDSIGSFYIFKRNVSLDSYAGRFVASFSSRPNSMKTFHTVCETAIEGWNAECLIENADGAFIQHLDEKFKSDLLLADGVDLSKSINPNSKPSTNFGLYPTVKNQSHLMQLFVSYCWQKHTTGYDEDGEPIVVLGVELIDDIWLLDEIIGYKAGKNADRIIAASHALAWDRYLTMLNVVPAVTNPEIRKKKNRKRRQMSAFSNRKYNSLSRK